VPEESFRLLRGLELFSMLPVAIVENLAVRAQRGYFYPGDASSSRAMRPAGST
jgi:hypothetical protein